MSRRIVSDEYRRCPSRADAAADRACHAVHQGQAPGEHPPQRLAQEREHAEDQHAEPKMSVVIERQIAIAGMPVRGQIEQQQEADAGQQDETRIAHARGDRLRSGRQPLVQPHRRDQHDAGGREQPHARRVPASRTTTRPSDRARKRDRPRRATELRRATRQPPRRRAPARRRARAGRAAARDAASPSRQASTRPTATPPNAAARALPRSWRRSWARAGPRPSGPTPAPVHRPGGLRRMGLCSAPARPAARRDRPGRAWQDAHRAPRRAATAHWRAPSRVAALPWLVDRASERSTISNAQPSGIGPDAVGPIECVALDEGRQLRVGSFDGIAQGQQVA